jgi:hypothetical protein
MYRNSIRIRAAAGCLGHSGLMVRDEVAQDFFRLSQPNFRRALTVCFETARGANKPLQGMACNVHSPGNQ